MIPRVGLTRQGVALIAGIVMLAGIDNAAVEGGASIAEEVRVTGAVFADIVAAKCSRRVAGPIAGV